MRKSITEALEVGTPVSQIPLNIFKSIPYPLKEIGKYHHKTETFVSLYP